MPDDVTNYSQNRFKGVTGEGKGNTRLSRRLERQKPVLIRVF